MPFAVIGTDVVVTLAQSRVVLGGANYGTTRRFLPNWNASYECESGSEKFFINLNRSRVTVTGQKLATVSANEIRVSYDHRTEDVFRLTPEGTLEWDVVYDDDPRSGAGDFVEHFALTLPPSVTAHYQPALTPEEIAAGRVRPDHVVGSYAIYCDRRNHVLDAQGQTIVNYRAGKLGHIYRPKVTDALGAWTWASLNYAAGVLAVTIPGAFLDGATFPVTLDPNFGDETDGASALEFENVILGIEATPVSNGTGASITARLVESSQAGAHTAKCNLYNASGYAAITNGQTGARNDFTTSEAWYTFNFLVAPSISSAITYVICVWTGGGAGTLNLDYDTLTDQGRDDDQTYGTWPDPLVPAGAYANRSYSIYCTYTTASSASAKPSTRITLMGVGW